MNIESMSDKELLQLLIKRNKWTQIQLAHELGYKVHSHVSSVLNGKGSLSGSTRKLAEMLYSGFIIVE